MCGLLNCRILTEGRFSQRVRGSINETARHTICSYAERVGEFTLTDDVHDGSATLSPNIFLCLAQLQGPLAPLFPNLRHLRIVNAKYSLEYLRLFLSPSLETLEIVGLGETCRAVLLSFLSAAVVEVPSLSTLILGPGRLSRDVMNTCLGFDRLKHLELVNVVLEADYQLLKDIGGLEHLETFVIDAQDVGYAPSQAILRAERNERARVIAENELCRQRIEETQEHRKRYVEELEERRRKATIPRMKGLCWMCGIGCEEDKTQCSSCTLENFEQEKYMRELEKYMWELEEEDERRRKEDKRKRKQEESKRRVSQWKQEDEMRQYQEAKRKQRRCEETDEEMRRVEAVAEYKGCKEEEDLYRSPAESKHRENADPEDDDEVENLEVEAEMGCSVIDESLPVENTDGSDSTSFPGVDDGSGAQASIGRQEGPPHAKFPKLLDITVRGSTEMIQDVVELITSVSVVLLCLEMVPVLSSNIATPSSRRFVDTVDSALSRWASTIAHVTLSVPTGVASKLPDEVTEALVYLPQLEHLELNGWDVASNIANYFLGRLWEIGASKLKVLHLHNDSNTTAIPLSRLQTIARACPNLRSLRCRFDNLNIPSYSFPAQIPFPHPLETLTVGDTQLRLESDAVLNVARYVDSSFPKLKAIKPLEGSAQNADQWRYIDKLVKFRQCGHREATIGAFSI